MLIINIGRLVLINADIKIRYDAIRDTKRIRTACDALLFPLAIVVCMGWESSCVMIVVVVVVVVVP